MSTNWAAHATSTKTAGGTGLVTGVAANAFDENAGTSYLRYLAAPGTVNGWVRSTFASAHNIGLMQLSYSSVGFYDSFLIKYKKGGSWYTLATVAAGKNAQEYVYTNITACEGVETNVTLTHGVFGPQIRFIDVWAWDAVSKGVFSYANGGSVYRAGVTSDDIGGEFRLALGGNVYQCETFNRTTFPFNASVFRLMTNGFLNQVLPLFTPAPV